MAITDTEKITQQLATKEKVAVKKITDSLNGKTDDDAAALLLNNQVWLSGFWSPSSERDLPDNEFPRYDTDIDRYSNGTNKAGVAMINNEVPQTGLNQGDIPTRDPYGEKMARRAAGDVQSADAEYRDLKEGKQKEEERIKRIDAIFSELMRVGKLKDQQQIRNEVAGISKRIIEEIKVVEETTGTKVDASGQLLAVLNVMAGNGVTPGIVLTAQSQEVISKVSKGWDFLVKTTEGLRRPATASVPEKTGAYDGSRRSFLKVAGVVAAVAALSQLAAYLSQDRLDDGRVNLSLRADRYMQQVLETIQMEIQMGVITLDQGFSRYRREAQVAGVDPTAVMTQEEFEATMTATQAPTSTREPATNAPDATARATEAPAEVESYTGSKEIDEELVNSRQGYFRELPWMSGEKYNQQSLDTDSLYERFKNNFLKACADNGYTNLVFDFSVSKIKAKHNGKDVYFEPNMGVMSQGESPSRKSFEMGWSENIGAKETTRSNRIEVFTNREKTKSETIETERFEAGKSGLQIVFMKGEGKTEKLDWADYLSNDEVKNILLGMILKEYPSLKGRVVTVNVMNYDYALDSFRGKTTEAFDPYTDDIATGINGPGRVFLNLNLAVSPEGNNGKIDKTIFYALFAALYEFSNNAESAEKSFELGERVVAALVNHAGVTTYPIIKR